METSEQAAAAAQEPLVSYTIDLAPLLEPISKITGKGGPCGQWTDAHDGVMDVIRDTVANPLAVVRVNVPGAKEEDPPVYDFNSSRADPNWTVVRDDLVALFKGEQCSDKTHLFPTKHLGLASMLTLALVETDGLPGLFTGFTLIRELAERFWDSLYPLADEGFPENPYHRRLKELRPLDGVYHDLEDPIRLLERVLAKPVLREVKDDGGHLTVGAVISAAPPVGIQLPSSILVSDAQLEIYKTRDPVRTQEALQLVKAAEASVQGLIQQFGVKVGGASIPQYSGLLEVLRLCATRLDSVSPGITELGGNDDEDHPQGTRERGSGKLASPEAAKAALKGVANFFDKNNPASPIPFLLRRADRVIGLKFDQLLVEFGFESKSLKDFGSIAGIKPKASTEQESAESSEPFQSSETSDDSSASEDSTASPPSEEASSEEDVPTSEGSENEQSSDDQDAANAESRPSEGGEGGAVKSAAADSTEPAAPAKPTAEAPSALGRETSAQPIPVVATLEMARVMLLEIREYLTLHQRASPAKYLVDRAIKISEFDFMQLIEELGMDEESVDGFRRIAGIPKPQPKEAASKPDNAG